MENKEFANLCDKAKGNQEMWNAGYDKALEDVKREIIMWQQIKCIDGKEKCHECIEALKEKINKLEKTNGK